MQLDILNSKHEKLLKEEIGLTLAEFKNLPYAELDKLVDDKIMWIECDRDSPYRDVAAEIIDSIYGPYNPEEINAALNEDDEAVAV